MTQSNAKREKILSSNNISSLRITKGFMRFFLLLPFLIFFPFFFSMTQNGIHHFTFYMLIWRKNKSATLSAISLREFFLPFLFTSIFFRKESFFTTVHGCRWVELLFFPWWNTIVVRLTSVDSNDENYIRTVEKKCIKRYSQCSLVVMQWTQIKSSTKLSTKWFIKEYNLMRV